MRFHINKISKVFPARQGQVIALSDVNFSVEGDEFVCIVGPSGCGKTTLLKIIANLLQPSSGSIIYSDETGDHTPRNAMVFQDQGLFPWMTILDNVAFGLEMQKVERISRHEQAREFLNRVGLKDFIHNYPYELSGGMCQRVAILRAFLSNPEILLMDEPFGSLDFQTRLLMQEELLKIWKEHRKTILYVTHDIDEAILLGDRVLVMSGRPGCIQAEIPITHRRPRLPTDRDLPEFIELRWKIWNMLENEARMDLGIMK